MTKEIIICKIKIINILAMRGILCITVLFFFVMCIVLVTLLIFLINKKYVPSIVLACIAILLYVATNWNELFKLYVYIIN